MALQIFAHRGHHVECPENTLSAFRAAAQIGAHGIEIDIRLTRDGHPVVLHDASVDRTTDGAGLIADSTLEELQQLDIGAGEHIPSLSETLETPDQSLRINIHLKATDDDRLVSAVVAEIVQHKMLDRAYLATGESTWRQPRALEPRLTGCHLGCHPRNTADFLEKTHSLGCRIVQIDWKILDAPFVALAHDLGIEVHAMHLKSNYDDRVYTVLPPTGVDAILTDYSGHWINRLD